MDLSTVAAIQPYFDELAMATIMRYFGGMGWGVRPEIVRSCSQKTNCCSNHQGRPVRALGDA